MVSTDAGTQCSAVLMFAVCMAVVASTWHAGSIPDSLGSLGSLQVLDLSYNQLSEWCTW